MTVLETEQAVMTALHETAKQELHDRREKYDIPQATLEGLWSDVKIFLDPRAEMQVHVKKDEIATLSLNKPFGDQGTQNVRGINIDLSQSHMDVSIGFDQKTGLSLIGVDAMIRVDDHSISRYVKQYIVERDGDYYRFWHFLYGWPNWVEAGNDSNTMKLTRELFDIAKNQYVLTHSRGSAR
jgi:hypothetical protein